MVRSPKGAPNIAPNIAPNTTIKFLCSYGGTIRPRYPDGKLRYHGGDTRVLAVDRSISFSELLVRLGEMCGRSVSLRCQLPTEDLDALVSITSDEDLANLIEEFDRAASISSASSSLKIRAFLSQPKSVKRVSPPPPNSSSYDVASTSSFVVPASAGRCLRRISPSPFVLPPICFEKSAGKIPHYAYHGNPRQIYLVHNGNHWQ